MPTQYDPAEKSVERAGYVAVSGAHLYTVLHEVPDPMARILLVGPFASQRHSAYMPWVSWARYLAARQIECLRYDYRGVGESTGAFVDMSFDTWSEDVQILARWLRGRLPDVPLILHGLDMGALLAARIFQMGMAEALLLWSPPASANQALRATLVRQVGLEQLFRYVGADRRRPSDYIRQLEAGFSVEVDGYEWSSRLWRDSFNLHLPPGIGDEGASAHHTAVKIVRPENAAPLIKGSSVAYDTINRDFSQLFAQNFDWISTALAVGLGGGHERSH
jgi:pimeloyl-ACP methyl ester carboxylesterase